MISTLISTISCYLELVYIGARITQLMLFIFFSLSYLKSHDRCEMMKATLKQIHRLIFLPTLSLPTIHISNYSGKEHFKNLK